MSKIVYFHKGFWPSNSPSTTFITNNTKGFYKNKVDFTLITGNNLKKQPKYILKNYFSINEDLNIISINCFIKSSTILKIIAFWKLFFINFDTIITRDLSFIPSLLLIKKFKKRIKIIYESHDFFYDLSIRNDICSDYYKRHQRIENIFLKKINGIICVSEKLKTLYQKYLPNQHILTATTGLSIKTVSNKTIENKKNLTLSMIYIGSLKPSKYPLEIIIEAISRCKNKNHIRFTIVGVKSTGEKEYYKKIAAKYGVSENIILLGWLNQLDINEYLLNSDVGVAILTKTFLNNIASPLKILEYISIGLPIICTDLEGIRDIIKDKKHGFLLNNDHNEWSEIIDYIFENRELLSTIRNNCIELANELTWEKRAEKIVNFLNN